MPKRFTRGHNWGVPNLQGDKISFDSFDETGTLFTLPLSTVKQVQASAKEIAVQFAAEDGKEGESFVSEIRFHVPGDAVLRGDFEALRRVEGKAKADTTDGDADASMEEAEEKDATQVLLGVLKSKCDDDGAKGCIAHLDDIQVLAPKARLDFDLFDSYMRVRGARQSWRVNYTGITQMHLVPAPDGVTRYLVIALTTPIKQGQQPYYHLVLSFDQFQVMEESSPYKLNVTEEDLERINGRNTGPKLTAEMSGPVFEIVAKLLKAMSGVKIIGPSLTFESCTSKENQPVRSISCSTKQSIGSLYPLEKGFLFLPKPTVYVRNEDISKVKFSNVGVLERYFNFTIAAKDVVHEFQSVDRKEYDRLVAWLQKKEIRAEGTRAEVMRQQAELLAEESDEDESDADFDSDDSEDSEEGDSDGKKSKKKEKKAAKKAKKEAKRKAKEDKRAAKRAKKEAKPTQAEPSSEAS